MDNLQLPAYPLDGLLKQTPPECRGFSKLEVASLMIAQGYTANPMQIEKSDEIIARWSVSMAKAVIEEANK